MLKGRESIMTTGGNPRSSPISSHQSMTSTLKEHRDLVADYHQQLQQLQQQQQQQQQYTGPPPYMMGPRGMPNGGMRGHVPAPLNVPPSQRNLNGPLSHSSPRVIGAAGNVVGDYYWGS